MNNALACTFKEARLAARRGPDLEHNKNVGQVSTIMRLITSKDEDLSSCSRKKNENEIDNTSFKQIVINNHEIYANKGKIKGQLPLEHIFSFCKIFKKITKNLGFHLTFKTADLQDIIFTTLGDDIKMKVINLYIRSFLYLFQVLKHKPCLINLSRIIIQFRLILGIVTGKWLLVD